MRTLLQHSQKTEGGGERMKKILLIIVVLVLLSGISTDWISRVSEVAGAVWQQFMSIWTAESGAM